MAQKTYYLIDDTDVTKGAGSGQPLSPPFQANNDGDAQLVATTFAGLFQRGVRVVGTAGGPPWTTKGTPNNSMFVNSLVPSQISY